MAFELSITAISAIAYAAFGGLAMDAAFHPDSFTEYAEEHGYLTAIVMSFVSRLLWPIWMCIAIYQSYDDDDKPVEGITTILAHVIGAVIAIVLFGFF